MKKATARSLAKTAVLDASDKPEEQDEARKRRVDMDFKSWRKQTRAGKTTHQEEVGITSSVKMKQAQEKAKRDLIQDKAVAKQKATFRGYSSDDMEKKKVKKEEVQFDEVYKKLPVAKMASKISKKQFKAGQSGDVKTISKKSTETGKMIGVLDTHDPERSKAKSKIKEAKVDAGDDVEREEGRNKRKFGTKGNYGHTLVRRRMHRANRGEKKIRGNKEVNVATGKVGKEIGEATRYSKETGKNLKSGKPYVKGGTAKGDTAYKNVLARIKKDYGPNAVQQSSKEPKKVKGDKTRRQVGDRKFTPADTIAKRRAAKAAYIKSRSGD